MREGRSGEVNPAAEAMMEGFVIVVDVKDGVKRIRY